ncbi:MAG TPA: acetyl-CoA decarbonylase/synthase complex subunit gamma [Candidatus Latescibacteria bacterium]|nr:acetyl-CoA decarbonylase/synthase complex subunit gamma [Candidatus Latescibacterota bacterium]
MALTGIEIYKKLPRTNCKECGFPTCLAFAMNLAAGKTELDLCPYVSEDAKANLQDAAAPPVRVVTIGTGDRSIKIGGETVMFRHEKTFVNKPAFAVLIDDRMDEGEVDGRLDKLEQFQYERVGLTFGPELVAIKETRGDPSRFEHLINKAKERNHYGLILMSTSPEILSAGLRICADSRPLLYAVTKENLDEVAGLARENSCPVAVRTESLDELSELTSKLIQLGMKEIVLDPGSRGIRKALEDQIIIRRAAVLNKYKHLGFPTITFPCEMTDDPMKEALIASIFIAKYAGIIVLSDLEGHSLFPLLLERLNIYTDPQRPMATPEGIYEIGGPDDNSPVLITSNFSLTYFIVSGEIETSRVPCYLLIKDTEGLSVMTAWAAGKFVAEEVAPFIKKCGIGEKVTHRKLIIPGYAAQISGELEEELPDWQIQIGPREASHLPAYLKMWKP